MIQRKVCMLGYFSVGKTSLVRQYVHSLFSEKYLTTIGVKVDKKVVNVDSKDVNLMLWDIEGEDSYCKLKKYYLKGASGFILVADITREHSIDKVIELKKRLDESFEGAPFVLAINKCDLIEEREVTEDQIKQLSDSGWNIFHTSAKTGENIEQMFHDLAIQMLETNS